MTNVLSIPTDFYVKVQNYIIDTAREGYPSGLIPVVNTEGEPYVYRIPSFSDLDVSKGILDWDAAQARADKALSYTDVKIFGRQMKIGFTSRDFRQQGEQMIGDKTQSIVGKFLDEVDYAMWHGNIEGNVTLSTGILTQATDTSHLNIAASDSVLDSAAELTNGLNVCVKKIPAKYRSKYPVVMVMNWGLYDQICNSFVSGTPVSVLEAFQKAHPYVTIVANSSAVLASADTDAACGRICIFPQNQDVIRKILAKEVSPIGPALVDLTGGIEQLWGTLFAPKVVDATAVYYTDTAITFA